MKNIVLIICIMFFTANIASAKIAIEVFNGVKDGQTVYYSTKKDKWFESIEPKEKKIIALTRSVSTGSGSYSEYKTDKGQMVIPVGSNYEFIFENRLITYHIFEMNFFEIVREKGKFIEKQLEVNDLKKLFSGIEVVYMSQFNYNPETKRNYLTLKKFPLIKKQFLFINDTDKYFYRYSFKPDVNDSVIKSLITIEKPMRIEYSHYIINRDSFPAYEIKIKNGF